MRGAEAVTPAGIRLGRPAEVDWLEFLHTLHSDQAGDGAEDTEGLGDRDPVLPDQVA